LSSKAIDEIDAKILKDLLIDGRKRFVAIAEEAHVTKDVICQHYSSMKKEGIIAGATAMINYRALGYDVNVSLSLRVLTPERQFVIDQLSKISGLYDVYQWGSNSSLWAVLHLDSTRKIENIERFVKRIPAVIKSDIEIWVGVRFLMSNLSVLFNKASQTDRFIINTESREIDVDNLDRQIIEKLVYDGRAPFSDIAKEAGASTSTVMRRFQELIDKHVIKPTIQINPLILGYPVDANFRLTTSGQADSVEVADKICAISDVYAIFNVMGAYDFRVFACVKDFKHLFDLESQIANVPGVLEIERPTVLPLTLECLPFPGVPMSSF
jgi:DNA-binding Lrp family transcriptional regulator